MPYGRRRRYIRVAVNPLAPPGVRVWEKGRHVVVERSWRSSWGWRTGLASRGTCSPLLALAPPLGLLALLQGCVEAHVAPLSDAAPHDTFVESRDGTSPAADALDAACRDLDGDGAADAACGGTDCDDADATIGPSASVCVGPTRVRRCADGLVVEEDCASPSPDCDGRTGACSATACGDLVVQPDEQCDGSALVQTCLTDCRQTCARLSDCAGLEDASSCIPLPDGRSFGVCTGEIDGASPLGSPCLVDSDCASAFCDPRGGRCSVVCNLDWSVDVAVGSWSSWTDSFEWASGDHDFLDVLPPRRDYRCVREADCSAGRHCTVVRAANEAGEMFVTSACVPSFDTTLDLGMSCVRHEATGCSSNNCVGARCTSVCLTDSDCSALLPHCVDFDFSVDITNLSPSPPWAPPRICAP